LAGQGGDFELGERPFLPGNVNPSSTFSANFHWLVEKKAFVRLITQSSDVCGGIRPLPGNLDSCQRHSPPSACRSEVEVLLVRKVESFLDREPGWLLPLHRGYAAEQNQQQPCQLLQARSSCDWFNE
jgi:hypothetical protein